MIGLKALESGNIRHEQIECIKQTILKRTKYKVKIWEKNNHYIKVTKKSIGIKMGKGYGKISNSILKISSGMIILEFSTIKYHILINILNKCKFKFSIKTKIVSNL